MSRSSTLLAGAFRDALFVALAGSPLACGDEGIEDDPRFVPAPCPVGLGYVESLSPGEPVDYLAFGSVADPEGSFSVQGERGEPCQGAGDAEECRSRLVEPLSEKGFALGGRAGFRFESFHALRATRGSQVVTVASYPELRDFLAPIDVPADAWMLASDGYTLTCEGRSGSRPVADGFEVQAFSHPGCDGRNRYLLHVDTAGEVTRVGKSVEREPDPGCTPGRRPPGLLPGGSRRRNTLASHFARCAELEAASVPAFEVLAGELALHAAPAGLVARAGAAAFDEVLHARAVARLARAFGGRLQWRRRQALPPRTLEAVALDNAVEGCVHETYGALVAHYQARAAADRRVRRLSAALARDEARHASLAWDIARWAEARLSPASRRWIARARRGAFDALRASACADVPAVLRSDAGLPGPEVAPVLVDRLAQRLLPPRRPFA